jgi:hypothetical protein
MFSHVYSISVSGTLNVTRVSIPLGASATGFTVPADGSVLFVIDQLNHPNANLSFAGTMNVDLSSIPAYELPTGNVLAFLLCEPHVSIQTRQVKATGNGNLTLGKHQPSQGNIDFYQANYLLSHILLNLPTDSGPTTQPAVQVGTDVVVRLIFGTDLARPINIFPAIPPAPLTNITAVYTQLIHSAMKTVLSGQIANETVPGGYAEERIVFTSSLGHVIISAILFAFLTIALVAAQLRKGRVPFTLVNVAAALADSDVPQKSMEMTEFKVGTGERKVLKLVLGGDGRLYCVYESVD